jgi:hypothetical protein
VVRTDRDEYAGTAPSGSGGASGRQLYKAALIRAPLEPGRRAGFARRARGELKTIDRIFGWLLILGSAGHTIGTVLWTEPMSGIFLWSLGSSLAAALLGVLNLVRAGRRQDKTLALITTIGTAFWAALALTFGFSIHNVLDPRAMTHFIVSVVLVIFGVRTLSRTDADSTMA